MPKFKELNLTYNDIPKTITINDIQVKVKQYIPVEDKIDLIQTALQKSEENGIYNDIKLDIHFHLNIVYLYTDIEFEQDDFEDEMLIYNRLAINNVFDKVIGKMDEDEYNSLYNFLQIAKKDNLEYKNSAAAVLRRMVQDLPKNAEAAKEIVDSFDRTQYQDLLDFTVAANGGRNIKTNRPVEENVETVNKQTVPVSLAADSNTSSIEPSKDKVVELKSVTKKD